MILKQTKPIQLKVPLYRQHYDFTCGPASVMMALKYLDKSLHLSKDLEIDLWREGNMVELYGTSRYGLAFSAVIRGFRARVYSNTGKIDFVDKLVPRVADLNNEALKLHFNERKDRCRKLGVEEKQETITTETISNSLLSNHIPLTVTNALFCKGENLPHWIAVTGMDDKFLYFNNPLYSKLQKGKFKLSNFEKVVGYHGDQSMVEIWR